MSVLGAELDPALAEVRLRAMVRAAEAPALTDAEVSQLLDMARRADRNGRAPGDDDWTPTWALAAAAAEGWRWKAGALVDQVDVSADDASVKASQLRAHCLDQAKLYGAQGGIVSVPLEGVRRPPDGTVINLAEAAYEL